MLHAGTPAEYARAGLLDAVGVKSYNGRLASGRLLAEITPAVKELVGGHECLLGARRARHTLCLGLLLRVRQWAQERPENGYSRLAH